MTSHKFTNFSQRIPMAAKAKKSKIEFLIALLTVFGIWYFGSDFYQMRTVPGNVVCNVTIATIQVMLSVAICVFAGIAVFTKQGYEEGY